jgi:hypothetical protein
MIEQIVQSFYAAMHRDLPNVEFPETSWENGKRVVTGVTKTRRPYENELEIFASFAQAWGSTALGFGGIGGSAITTAMTTIITDGKIFCVYFGGALAYKLEKPKEAFYDDVKNRCMKPVSEVKAYR